jgi:hypothetical protein
MEEYQLTEEKYINAISSFMAEMDLNRVYVNALEKWSNGVGVQNANEFLSRIWIGKAVTAQEVQELAKLVLRHAVWCKLGVKKQFFVHFGYDYYMYIGVSKICGESIDTVDRSGLFVEEFDSPYLN